MFVHIQHTYIEGKNMRKIIMMLKVENLKKLTY
jgi:hypothetical protein